MERDAEEGQNKEEIGRWSFMCARLARVTRQSFPNQNHVNGFEALNFE
jgi:hypothetical protein